MRYAVPVSNGVVSEHFGFCEEFAFFDTDTEGGEVLRKELLPSPGHQPGLLPEWLAEQGASVIIAKGMGNRAQSLFSQNRIQVVTGALHDDPEQVVLDHLRGVLVEGDNPCDH